MKLTMKQLVRNTMVAMKSDILELSRKKRDALAAYVASRNTMDAILRFAALSHPVLAYYLRCMRLDHEGRGRYKARNYLRQLEEEVLELRGELKKARSMAQLYLFEQREAPMTRRKKAAVEASYAAENALLRAENRHLRCVVERM